MDTFIKTRKRNVGFRIFSFLWCLSFMQDNVLGHAMYLFDQNNAAVMLISVRVFLNGKTGLPFTCEWQEMMVDEWLFCLKEHYTLFCLGFFFLPESVPNQSLSLLAKVKCWNARWGGGFLWEVKSNTKTTRRDKAHVTWAFLIGGGKFSPLSGSPLGEAGNIFTLFTM